MASELGLMNAALAHLGEERVLSDLNADPPPRELAVAKALLPDLRDAMLRESPWLCAEARVTVSRVPLAAPIDHKFANVFLLPIDTLRVWNVDTCLPWQAGTHVERFDDGKVKDRRAALFCSGEGPLNVTIIERVAYEHLTASLADAMALRLASRMAGPLQADKALRNSLKAEAEEAVARAVTVETSEFRDDPVVERGRWLSAR